MACCENIGGATYLPFCSIAISSAYQIAKSAHEEGPPAHWKREPIHGCTVEKGALRILARTMTLGNREPVHEEDIHPSQPASQPASHPASTPGETLNELQLKLK